MVDSVALAAAAQPLPPAPAVAAQPPVPVLDFATPPPAAVLAAGGIIAATVVAIEAGVLELDTIFGPISLRTSQVLPPGAAVQVAIVPGAQAGASLLLAPGTPGGALSPRAGTAAAGSAGDPTEIVALGQAVRATVLAAGSAADAPAVGSSLSLRITATLSAAAPLLPATVLGAAGDSTILETPLGRLALEASTDFAPGATLAIERLDAPEPPAASPPASPSPLLGSGWSTLDAALSTLDQSAPDLAARLRAELAPESAPKLAAMLLFLVGSLKGNQSFAPESAIGALALAGRRELAQKLQKDVSELRRLAAGESGGEWRIFTLPVLDESAVQPIRLYLRPQQEEATPTERAARGTRFVLDLELSRLGALQLDGLVRGGRFDLLLRSHRPFDAETRHEIGQLFRSALDGTGLKGDISFSVAARFPVAPLDALRPHLGLEV